MPGDAVASSLSDQLGGLSELTEEKRTRLCRMGIDRELRVPSSTFSPPVAAGGKAGDASSMDRAPNGPVPGADEIERSRAGRNVGWQSEET